MAKSTTYEDWKKYASRFDNLKDIKLWKDKLPSKNYDYKYI